MPWCPPTFFRNVCVGNTVSTLPLSSYYPLLPAFGKEELRSQPKSPQTNGAATPTSQQAPSAEVNLDLMHMFDEYEYACLPVRPDVLLLPSNLKPFAKVRQGEVRQG